MRNIFLIGFLLCSLSLMARQNEVDSLTIKTDELIQSGLKNFSSNQILASEQFHESLFYAKKAGYSSGEGRSYNLLGQLYTRQNKLDSAVILLNQAMRIYLNIADSTGICKTKISIGDIYFRKGDYVTTMSLYTEAMTISEQQNNLQNQLICYRKIGDFLWKTDQLNLALPYFLKGLKLSKELENPSNLIQYYISLGNYFSKVKDFDRSIQYFDSVMQNQNDVSVLGISAVYNSLGIVYFDKGNYQKSLDNYQLSKTIKEQLKDSVGLANSWNNLGNVFLKMNQFTKAEEAFLKSYEISKKIQAIYASRTALLNLSNLYEIKGDYKKALYFDNRYDSLETSLINESRNNQISEIREKYAAEKRESEILLLKKNEEVQNAISTSRLLQRNFLMGATILLFIILGLIYAAYQQKRKSNSLLEEQNVIITKREKEKELLLHEVNHRVKNNLQMVSGLLRLQSHNLQDEKAAEAVKEGQTRVEALTLIHKKIFENSDHTKIITSEYFRELVENLLLSTALPIQSKMNLEDIELDVDQAVPVALIVNELITNSLKYAFHSEKEGILEFSLVKKGEKDVQLSLQDNGDISFNPDLLKESRSFGINLVYTLAKQLKGDLSLDNSKGTKWNLIFPQLK